MSRLAGGDALRSERLERVDPLLPQEAYWLVGLLEAEAHFYIATNNGGANWRCGARIALRDDDADILLEWAERTGLGRVRPIPAARSSRPQACWEITSKMENAQIAAWCREFPMAGRRNRELTEWANAVGLLGLRRRGTTDTTWKQIAAHAERLRQLRRYAGSHDPAALPMDDGLFRAWLGGFFTGEGCLMLEPRRARLSVRLRRDDRPLLEALQARTGAGSIYDTAAHGSTAPASSWSVFSRADLKTVADLLARTPVRGRKTRQLAPWRDAVAALHAEGRGGRFTTAREMFREASAYTPPPPLPFPTRAITPTYEAYARVLRQFAAEISGPLTCTEYDAARRHHPEWPTRNTLVLSLGSWAEALDAAGLRHRAHARSAA